MKKMTADENTRKIKRVKMFMIFGFTAIIIASSVFMASFTLHKNDEILKNKVSDLIFALNVQMKLNVNSYLSKLETFSTLVFKDDFVVDYYSSSDNDEYEALETEKKISEKLNELCIMENYVDFFIIYSNDHTVGKVSNGTTKLFGDGMYNDMAKFVTKTKTNDGWSAGFDGDYRRVYYVKRVNENALLVVSFYASELENVLVRPTEMKDTVVRLVSSDYHIIYSSSDEKTGSLIPEEVFGSDILGNISSQNSVSMIDDNYLITSNKCADGWYIICSAPTQAILSERKVVIGYTVIVTAIASVIASILGAFLSIHATNPVDSIVTTLDKEAKVDKLTGIYNKLSFEENTAYMLGNARSGERHAIILLDVDNFKGVNDTLGHAYGDKVLSDIGNILRITFNSTDCIGRIGGDEFCVLLNIPDNKQSEYRRMIEEKCRALCEAFHSNYTGDNDDYKVSTSIGAAVFPDNGKTFAELYKCADKALYHSKHKGKDTFTIYSSEDENEDQK